MLVKRAKGVELVGQDYWRFVRVVTAVEWCG
jgi:hypothetical protein